AFLPVGAGSPVAPFEGGLIMSDFSDTTSNIRGFSRWNSSSKYNGGIVESGVIPCPRLSPPEDRLLPLASYGELARELIDNVDGRRSCDLDPNLSKSSD